MTNSKKEPFQRYFFPALLWLIIITGLSVMPGIQLPEITILAPDKLAHAFVYGVLVWLFLRGFYKRDGAKAISLKRGFGLFLFACLYGTLMEFVQDGLFPHRFFEVYDMLANAIGAAIGWLVGHLMFGKKSA